MQWKLIQYSVKIVPDLKEEYIFFYLKMAVCYAKTTPADIPMRMYLPYDKRQRL
jgi:hypothetical protein